MVVKSKIKAMFNKELRRYFAAICDTRQIQNNILKMDLLQRILTVNGIQSEQLGGATNRYVTMIDGYAVKFAVDRQGYKDNLMEYALAQELQPRVTRSYETNGYILIHKCVRILTEEEWRMRKIEILKILDELGREYLLGDVGYYDLNRTNWGVTDEGDLVIVDYAYCHRLTEGLFTCPVCGAVLSYDQNFTSFICTDRANCHAKYTYNQIKAIQGDAVDWDMIEEKKKKSLVIPKGKDSITVDRAFDTMLDSRTFIIRNYADLERYKEVKNNMLTLDYNDPEVFALMTRITQEKVRPVPDTGEIAKLEKELDKYRKEVPEVKCIIDPDFQEKMMEDQYNPGKYSSKSNRENGGSEDESSECSLADLLRKLHETDEEGPDTFDNDDWDGAMNETGDQCESDDVDEAPVEEDQSSEDTDVIPIWCTPSDDSRDDDTDNGETEKDDVVGEPDSELETAIESDLPAAPVDDGDDEFTSESVVSSDATNEELPIEITVADVEESADPEEVIFDGVSLGSTEENQNDDNVVEYCNWTVDGVNWHTDCDHTYFPYCGDFEGQPSIMEDEHGAEICPWCGNLINYIEDEEEDGGSNDEE